MPSSRRRYSRAQFRQRARKPRKSSSSRVWTVAIVVVVAVGVGLVVVSRQENQAAANERPRIASGDQPGDHWHAAVGVNVCGEWISNPPEFHTRAGTGNVQAGIHSHGDGLIHIHPFTANEAGENATLGKFFEFGGWELREDAFRAWDGAEHSSGDMCGKKEATVRWSVDGKEQTGDPADYRSKNGDVIAIALLPKGEKIGEPPSAGTQPVDEPANTGASSPPPSSSSSSTRSPSNSAP
ncbi:MAG: hypothetical protein ACREJR_03960 [Candidatus Rokuibacteriota bacterium]